MQDKMRVNSRSKNLISNESLYYDMYSAKEIRESFKDFFHSKGHQIVPSAPMVIKDDPTLMFTNAGMNQFKDIILGNVPPKYKRATDSQKCLRVSGKHNDLEEVGLDTYHHTMFEMLGNWSFGDYFKEGAIDYAWEYLVDVLHLNPDDLYVTVFEGAPEEGLSRDDEAAGYWLKHVSADHIINGNKHDNFWEMGETGPCGPCSEIHLDSRTPEEKAKTPGRELVNKDDPQVIEIWNIVFMQYNRKADGSLEPLPMHVIDTGMGFERLVRALQGKHSNYDTDVFQPLIQKISQLSGKSYGKDEKVDVAMRVIADHVRTIAFSIAEAQLPSNAKAGYVIRRILRRAVRYAYTFLDQRQAFIYRLVDTLIESMGDAYPELKQQPDLIKTVIKEEEDTFLRTLETGIKLLDKVVNEAKADGRKEVSGTEAFVLYDTYGFPLDLTELILKEHGFTVNHKEFDEEMAKQKRYDILMIFNPNNKTGVVTALSKMKITATFTSDDYVWIKNTDVHILDKLRKIPIDVNIWPYKASEKPSVEKKSKKPTNNTSEAKKAAKSKRKAANIAKFESQHTHKMKRDSFKKTCTKSLKEVMKAKFGKVSRRDVETGNFIKKVA